MVNILFTVSTAGEKVDLLEDMIVRPGLAPRRSWLNSLELGD
jgi:hypothetical protein